MNEQQLARGLGWFSIGLGLAELIAPQQVSRAIGVRNHHNTLRLLGAREIGNGIAILSQKKPTESLWSRVAGDAMDLGLLASALSEPTTDRRRLNTAIAAVAGVTALDLWCSVQLSRSDARGNAELPGRNGNVDTGKNQGAKRPMVRKSITINRPAEEIYQFWRNFENLPRFMNHLKAVTISADNHSHWVAKGPAGTEVEWDAEITEEIPGQLIAWRSLAGATVENEGSVRFEPATGGRGTVVRVHLNYRPPGGQVGATIAKLLGEAPENQIPGDLHRIKQLLETGEIARTEGQPAGRSRSTSRRYDDLVRS